MSNPAYETILDESNQLIQVADLETFAMRYANKAAIHYTGHADRPFAGEKCYEYMMGLTHQCPFCPLLARSEDDGGFEIDVDNGVNVFKVKTVLTEWEGRPAFIEYATDITAVYRAKNAFDSQMKTLVDSIPEAQGVFHINVTRDVWVNSNGLSHIVQELRKARSVDALVSSISAYIPDEEMRERFFRHLCRQALLDTFAKGRTEIAEETLSYYDDGSVRWSRITARLILNPTTGDLEGIIYGVDISDERKYREQIAEAEREKAVILEKSRQDILTDVYNKSAFIALSDEYLRVRPNQEFAVLFLDLDNFKAVNDSLGHLFGDKVIIETAETLQSIYSGKDIISRFGGDEFCLLIKGIPYEKLLDKLKFTLKKMEKTYRENDREVKVTASIGVAYCKDGATDILPWIEKADLALYQAKKSGRNQFRFLE